VARKRLIVGEGQGDAAFFRQLIKVRKLADFQVFQREKKEATGDGAFEAMLRSIKTNRQYDDCSLIVVVADNDSDPAESFQKIAKQIKNAQDYAVPTKPREVAKADALRSVSVLMLPWDDVPGALDSVCYSVAAARRPAIAACVEQYAKCANATDWAPSPLAKLRLRCLLSASCPKDPNIGITHAWSKNKKPKDLIPLRRNGLFLKDIVTYLKKLP
jgi:hypothetical protein